MKEHERRYLTIAKNSRIDGANTITVVLAPLHSACSKFQVVRFMKCMGEWEAADLPRVNVLVV